MSLSTFSVPGVGYSWGKLRQLLFLLAGVLCATGAHAQYSNDLGFFNNYVIINGTYYKTDVANASDGTNASFPSSLGSFDRTSGTLTLGAQLNTYEHNGNVVASPAQLFYRVYPTTNADGSTGPSATYRFNPISIPKPIRLVVTAIPTVAFRLRIMLPEPMRRATF
ncbi:hypothetical protein [Hymenobacter sp. BRD67]|uniref:hypothetical protein n=1 Tax=Hymenobacter sp. BRD67 TaxID=2675877 RepID=UPI001565E33F|nr:hypothetical protein [Hymenobacter sp. BRD67]QKG53778.1 hypothetical protein GKZ67_15705 [Hymenobacter sp. BRD67]